MANAVVMGQVLGCMDGSFTDNESGEVQEWTEVSVLQRVAGEGGEVWSIEKVRLGKGAVTVRDLDKMIMVPVNAVGDGKTRNARLYVVKGASHTFVQMSPLVKRLTDTAPRQAAE
ncbi:hypothetical protein ACM64Y_01770 [Novispirillum sp. DQ9]|uniref:hypothetical protein n=1 Tax=Novispirillum sp. DQ9 TaxID=3398612 RepID=UPI003C7DD5EF